MIIVTGREGRLPIGALLPVQQFGLRAGVYTIGDVVILENGYDPVKEIAIFVPCACDVISLPIQGVLLCHDAASSKSK
jgi:hypothetical protein